jgi:sodium-dependent dicarboxylate transporter 2/3/5
MTPTRAVGLVAGLLAFALLAGLDGPLHHDPTFGSRPAFAAAGAALMAIWWLTEAIPIYWTACLPILIFPLFGVFGTGPGASLRSLGAAYLDPYIFLFAGGMAIAAAMQQWNLHRRIALTIMKAIGSDPRRLLAGTLCATAFISLWISNTATATMMVPIGIALVAQLEDRGGGKRLASFGMAIMLSIAYGANIGGIGTKIGTAPNAQLAGFLERMGTSLSFGQFLVVGLPFVLMFLPVAWLALWRMGRKDAPAGDSGAEVVARELALLGGVQRAEKWILAVFGLAALGWIGGRFLTAALKPVVAPFALSSAHVEAGVALVAALVLLVLGSRHEGRRRALLEPRSLLTVPWETLLLLGGGFAMAAGVQESGLSVWLTGELAGLRALPGFSQVVIAAVAAVALSAVASNTATVAVLLVVLKDAVAPDQVNTVLFAVTIAASCDFALPAGTPPNAIVFGSGYVTIPRMARTGFVLDFLAALLAAAWCSLAVPRVL